MSNVVSETKLFRLHESVSANTSRLCTLQKANEKASTSLEIMCVPLGRATQGLSVDKGGVCVCGNQASAAVWLAGV